VLTGGKLRLGRSAPNHGDVVVRQYEALGPAGAEQRIERVPGQTEMVWLA
jgi:hypothetical protein